MRVAHSPDLFHSTQPGTITAPAHLRIAAVPGFVAHVRQAFDAAPGRHLLIDLSQVTHAEAGIIRPLLWAHLHARGRGGTLEFLAPPSWTLGNAENLALQRLCSSPDPSPQASN